MYRAVIVDDEREPAERLRRMVASSPFAERLEVSVVTPSPEAPLEVGPGSVDLLFMDVRLGRPEGSGIDLVESLLARGGCAQVIYVSGYLEHATDVYRTPHTWFLSKPVEEGALSDALGRAIANLDDARRDALLVRTGPSLVRILPQEILYVESDRRKVRVHCRERVVETYAKMDEVEARLPRQFVRCHKSFLVNMDCISELGSFDLTLSNGETVPISQRRKRSVYDRFVEYVGRVL